RWSTGAPRRGRGPEPTARTRRRSPAGRGRADVRTLIVNPGSSSLKLRILDDDDDDGGDAAVVATHDLPCREGEAELEELAGFLGDAPLDGAGIRFVHGGADFRRSVVVDRATVEALAAVRDLAPLHNPPALDALRALGRL